jgi:hypothetical protein
MDLKTIDHDFEEKEVEKIKTYVANGLIGLQSVVKDEHKVNAMFGLYMEGKTYTEISKISKTKKDIVLYLSAKLKWYEQRMDYLEDIQSKMVQTLKTTKIQSLSFIQTLITMQHKYYGDVINQYLMTGNRDLIDGLDLKQLTQYFKSIEILERTLNPTNVKSPKGGTTVNINTQGGTVEQIDDKTLEITPGITGDVLRALAKQKDDKKKDD